MLKPNKPLPPQQKKQQQGPTEELEMLLELQEGTQQIQQQQQQQQQLQGRRVSYSESTDGSNSSVDSEEETEDAFAPRFCFVQRGE